MKFKLLFCGLLALAIAPVIFAKSHKKESSSLKDAVILIIRHGEKPDRGYELSPAGQKRAEAYVDYFKTYTVDSKPLKLDSLFAAADTKDSHRPRLTIEPTAKALGLTIDSRFAEEDFQKLADELQSQPHGKGILICWHHSYISHLLHALGADAGELLPDEKWPDAVFNWVIQLRYDSSGRLIETKRIVEKF